MVVTSMTSDKLHHFLPFDRNQSRASIGGHLCYSPERQTAQYDELRMRQHGSLPKLYADDLRQYTSLNMATRVPKEDFPPCDKR